MVFAKPGMKLMPKSQGWKVCCCWVFLFWFFFNEKKKKEMILKCHLLVFKSSMFNPKYANDKSKISQMTYILFIFFQITGFDSHVNYLTDDSMNCQVLLFREKHNKQEMFYMLSLDF